MLMGLVDLDMLRSGPVLKEKDTGDVSKFLNRILGLSVQKQNMVSIYPPYTLKCTGHERPAVWFLKQDGWRF